MNTPEISTAPSRLHAFLNKQVANFALLTVKFHQHHWYITGDKFYELHVKFQEFYEKVFEHYDAVAERLLILGYKPAATMKEYLELTSLSEGNGSTSWKEIINGVITDFTQLNNELKAGIVIAKVSGDSVTESMLVEMAEYYQKELWMLKTYNMDSTN